MGTMLNYLTVDVNHTALMLHVIHYYKFFFFLLLTSFLLYREFHIKIWPNCPDPVQKYVGQTDLLFPPIKSVCEANWLIRNLIGSFFFDLSDFSHQNTNKIP